MGFIRNGFYICRDAMGDQVPDKVIIRESKIWYNIPKVPSKNFPAITCYFQKCKNHGCKYHHDQQYFNGRKTPNIEFISRE